MDDNYAVCPRAAAGLVGTAFNRPLVRLVQASPYVKQPFTYLARWNREHRRS